MQTKKVDGFLDPPQTRFLSGPNPFAPWIGEEHKSMKYAHISMGADGTAQIGEIVDHGTGHDGRIGPFLERSASAYAIFAAPPNHVTPARHVLPGAPELLLLLEGAATVKCGSASKRFEKGTFIIFEDDKGTGHSIEAGPAGYTAVKVLFVERKSA